MKINENIELYEDTIEMLTQISWKADLNNYIPKHKVNNKVSLFYDNYIQTKKEIVGRLTYLEALFLVLAVADTGCEFGGIDNRKEIINALNRYNDNYGKELIEDGKLVCIIDKKQEGFSIDSFTEKIEKMTQFQCFTITSIAYEVLIRMNRSNIVNFIGKRATAIIREAFSII